MRHIENKTCVRFMPATPNMTAYVQITKSDTNCGAHVGFLNTIQYVYLIDNDIGKGCMAFFKVAHELCHCCGKIHEHQCPPRDDYCTVNTENIQEGREAAFAKVAPYTSISYGATYDCGSVMHYNAYAFSSNGLKTLSCNCTIGQRTELSPNDIIEINSMYCSRTTTTSTTTTTTTSTSTTPMPTTSTSTTPITTTTSSTTTTTKRPKCRLFGTWC